jgi:hypothetical protein
MNKYKITFFLNYPHRKQETKFITMYFRDLLHAIRHIQSRELNIRYWQVQEIKEQSNGINN